jgi:hypothetical protein
MKYNYMYFILIFYFISCQSSIVGSYKLRSTTYHRIESYSIQLDKKGTYSYKVRIHSNIEDSIFGKWVVIGDTLLLTDERKSSNPFLVFKENVESTIKGTQININYTKDNSACEYCYVKLNNVVDTLTDIKGQINVSFKVISLKINNMQMGKDTIYMVKNGNNISVSYPLLETKFEIDNKWLVKSNRLILFNNKDTNSIILIKNKSACTTCTHK